MCSSLRCPDLSLVSLGSKPSHETKIFTQNVWYGLTFILPVLAGAGWWRTWRQMTGCSGVRLYIDCTTTYSTHSTHLLPRWATPRGWVTCLTQPGHPHHTAVLLSPAYTFTGRHLPTTQMWSRSEIFLRKGKYWIQLRHDYYYLY